MDRDTDFATLRKRTARARVVDPCREVWRDGSIAARVLLPRAGCGWLSLGTARNGLGERVKARAGTHVCVDGKVAGTQREGACNPARSAAERPLTYCTCTAPPPLQFGRFHNWQSISHADSHIMPVRDFSAPLVKTATTECFRQANQKSGAHMRNLGVTAGVQQVRTILTVLLASSRALLARLAASPCCAPDQLWCAND